MPAYILKAQTYGVPGFESEWKQTGTSRKLPKGLWRESRSKRSLSAESERNGNERRVVHMHHACGTTLALPDHGSRCFWTMMHWCCWIENIYSKNDSSSIYWIGKSMTSSPIPDPRVINSRLWNSRLFKKPSIILDLLFSKPRLYIF